MNASHRAGLVVRVALMATIAMVVGCSGGNQPHTAAVKGTVKFKGEPVSGASVSFIGTGKETPATAMTNADGTYELSTLGTKGAMPGNYTVTVDKTEMPAELTKSTSMEDAAKAAKNPVAEPKKLLPATYSDPAKSPLKFEVKDGTENKIDIELKE